MKARTAGGRWGQNENKKKGKPRCGYPLLCGPGWLSSQLCREYTTQCVRAPTPNVRVYAPEEEEKADLKTRIDGMKKTAAVMF